MSASRLTGTETFFGKLKKRKGTVALVVAAMLLTVLLVTLGIWALQRRAKPVVTRVKAAEESEETDEKGKQRGKSEKGVASELSLKAFDRAAAAGVPRKDPPLPHTVGHQYTPAEYTASEQFYTKEMGINEPRRCDLDRIQELTKIKNCLRKWWYKERKTADAATTESVTEEAATREVAEIATGYGAAEGWLSEPIGDAGLAWHVATVDLSDRGIKKARIANLLQEVYSIVKDESIDRETKKNMLSSLNRETKQVASALREAMIHTKKVSAEEKEWACALAPIMDERLEKRQELREMQREVFGMYASSLLGVPKLPHEDHVAMHCDLAWNKSKNPQKLYILLEYAARNGRAFAIDDFRDRVRLLADIQEEKITAGTLLKEPGYKEIGITSERIFGSEDPRLYDLVA